MAEHYNDRDQKCYTQDYVNALIGTSKAFLKQATAENKALRKKVKNMRKTVKQQGKCIKRMGAKIAGLDSQKLDDNLVFYVDWRSFAKAEFLGHNTIPALLDGHLALATDLHGSDKDGVIEKSPLDGHISFYVYDDPIHQVAIGKFTSSTNDKAMIVAEREHLKEYSVNGSKYVLARVHHDDIEFIGWIFASHIFKERLILPWACA